MNNVQIRPSTNVVISKTDAKYYIENSSTNLEILPTSYYEVFPNSSKYTGFSTDSSLGDFFNALNSDTREASGILGGMINSDKESLKYYAPENPLDYANLKSNQSAISGERSSENIGLAVFKDDKLIGELNGMETVCYSLVSNKIDNFFLTIEDPKDNEKYIDLTIYRNHAINKKVKIINSGPYITINCKLEGRIASIRNGTNYLDDSFLNEISKTASSYLESQLYNYLYKTSKKFRSDISGFGRNALKNFLTINEFNNYNWTDNYQNSFFKVNCDISIKSSYLITEI